MYKVSVIIPIYNMERFLRECLDSVLSQTLSDIEVICIDDGSTDNTMRILSEYCQKYDNIFVFRQKRKGVGCARNIGIKEARGEFISFMDSDDMYSSDDVLEYLYNGVKEKNVNIGGGTLCLLKEGRREKHPDKNMCILNPDCIVRSCNYQYPFGFTRYIFERNFLIEHNIFFPDTIQLEDPVFMCDALIAAGEIWLTSKEVYVYRQVDKKCDFTDSKTVLDMLNGYLQMMKKAYYNMYCDMQELLCERIFRQSNIFCTLINKGNPEIKDMLKEIEGYILSKELKRIFIEFWDDYSINKKYERNKERLLFIQSLLKKFPNVIIYGAGTYGKTLFDIVEKININKFLGFAVTSESPIGTARGYEINSLLSYKKYKNSALVIIAARDPYNEDMKNYAKELGFQNVVCINEDLRYLDISQIAL